MADKFLERGMAHGKESSGEELTVFGQAIAVALRDLGDETMGGASGAGG